LKVSCRFSVIPNTKFPYSNLFITKLDLLNGNYASVLSVQRPQIKVVESFEDEKSRDSFIQGLDVMQVDEDPEEQCENPDVQKESLAKESELVAEVESETDESEKELCSDTEEEYVPVGREQSQKKISQSQLNDMFRRVGLPKDAAELMTSELKAFNVLEKNVNVTFYRNREEAFRKYFTGESIYSESIYNTLYRI